MRFMDQLHLSQKGTGSAFAFESNQSMLSVSDAPLNKGDTLHSLQELEDLRVTITAQKESRGASCQFLCDCCSG